MCHTRHHGTELFLDPNEITCVIHRGFYTQTLLHADAFTHTHFHTQRLLHTEAFEECLYMTFYGPELKLFCF